MANSVKKRKSNLSSDPEKLAAQKRGQFKKGHKKSVGHGRPKLTKEQLAMQLTTRTQFKALIAQYSVYNLAEIKVFLKEKKLPAIDMAVLKHLEHMIEAGSMDRVDWTANHILGKEKETTNINVSGTMENTEIIDLKKLSKEQLLALKEIAEAGKK